MSDPKLTRVRVTIAYSSSDGYFSESTMSSSASNAHASGTLLEAIDELSRIAALFGFGDEAKAKFDGAQKRVAEFHKQRGAS